MVVAVKLVEDDSPPTPEGPQQVALKTPQGGTLLLGEHLYALAQDQVHKRRALEARWLDELSQYNSVYWAEEARKIGQIKERGRSTIFANLTRRMTDLGAARVFEALFPSFQRNWDLQASPKPEIDDTLSDMTPVQELTGQAQTDEQGNPQTVGDLSRQIKEEAALRARGMARTIEDQLAECAYREAARKAIEDAAIFGTGVIKGPVLSAKPDYRWEPDPTPDNPARQRLVKFEAQKPRAEWCDIWDFFPDMTATRMTEVKFVFERKMMTKRQLLDIQHLPGTERFRPNLMHVLSQDPTSYAYEDNRDQYTLFNPVGIANRATNRYPLWIYVGPMDPAQYNTVGIPEQTTIPAEQGQRYVIVWLVGPHILRALPYPQDTGEFPYGVFNWDKNPASIFGFGMPYKIRHPQRLANSALRMISDNGGLTALPQIILNRQAVKPQDGNYQLYSGKIWYLSDAFINDPTQAFATVDIPNHIPQFQSIFQMCRDWMQEESMQMPEMLGEGKQVSGTAQGTAIVTNNANISIRRLVSHWDQEVTEPLIRRFRDWNMQYSKDPLIKGDFKAVAIGSSVLMQREVVANNMMTFAMSFAEHPVFGPALKPYETIRRLAEVNNVAGCIKDREEYEAEMEAQAQAEAEQEPPPDPSQIKAQMDMQISEMKLEQGQRQFEARMVDAERDRQMDLRIKEIEQNIAMLRVSADQDVAFSKIEADMRKAEMESATAQQISRDQAKSKLATGVVKERGQNARQQQEIDVESPPRV